MKTAALAILVGLAAVSMAKAKPHSTFRVHAVFINGRPITELQIDRRVSDGKIYIGSGLTANDLELLKKDWPTRK
jgi:hypothetical protein